MSSSLDSAFWESCRRHWEYDGDEPSFTAAAARAAGGGKPPGRSAVHRHAHDEKWERRASLTDIAAAARQRADVLVNAEVAKKAGDAEYAARAFEDASNARAAVIARHRQEWGAVRSLVDEALEGRADDPAGSFDRAKLAKISAETLALKQAGERRAWGLDTFDGVDVTQLSDAQLAAIVKGKPA